MFKLEKNWLKLLFSKQSNRVLRYEYQRTDNIGTTESFLLSQILMMHLTDIDKYSEYSINTYLCTLFENNASVVDS